MRRLLALLVLVVLFPLVNATSTAAAQGTLKGGPCEGCEAVFEYQDEADAPLSPTATLPGFAMAQQKLLLRGRILMPDGKTPAENVILYIHQTNEDGEYATRGDEKGWARRHGYIRGWIKTGPDGRYSFHTQMPGSYSTLPAHVHPTLLEPDGTYYYLASWFFEGDPNYDENRHSEGGRGGSGLVALFEEDGLLAAERDIVLGLNVPGYRSAKRSAGHADTLHVNTSSSVVAWAGTKLWGRSGHTGTVPVESGWIARRGNLLVGGQFVIDMTSIRITDIPPDQPEPIKLLTSHLEDALFFHVAKYPQASFELLNSERTGYEDLLIVDGLLTIRGVTRPIQIPVYVNRAGTVYRSQFPIDRFDWNVAYEGGFGATRFAARNFVDREIELDITLEIEK